MNEAEFEKLADAALAEIEAALEACTLDPDLELKEGGILEVTFEAGGKLIINRHRAAREIWVAAPSGGFHFRWLDGAWRDTRNGTELFQALSALASEHGGKAVKLRP
jgi:CyaY protein